MGAIKQKSQQTKTTINGRHSEEDGNEERKPTDSPEGNCRCSEVSEKTFPEMFKLMISDLSFWKKTKREK
jgi:CRISPR/Cas system-associated protein endoribonuclease Cas2